MNSVLKVLDRTETSEIPAGEQSTHFRDQATTALLGSNSPPLQTNEANAPLSEHAVHALPSMYSTPNDACLTPADRALALANGSSKAILVLGGAGTGKTTFLHALQRDEGKRQVFLAPTGVAALRLRGQTIHSFFGIPPQIINQDEIEVNVRQRRLFRGIDRMVIDEISMVRADLLDVVDRTLRIARETNAPFGGMQVVLVGDFFQLPPVVPLADEEILDRLGYQGPYSFNAKVFPELVLDRVPFTIVYRQSDPAFIDCLNCVRRGTSIIATLATINDACVGPHRPHRMPVVLTPTIRRADIYNHEGLSRLQTPGRVYVGEAKGTFGNGVDKLPVPESLALKVGTRVMTVRNGPGLRWVNGSVGTVAGLADKSVAIRLDAGGEVEIERVVWEKIRYEWDPVRSRVAAAIVGTYTHLPLVHAWALTIHKAQGLTLEDARVDFDYGAFAPGQVYVAVSRCRSLDGLSLVRPIRDSEIKIDSQVAEYMQRFEKVT